MSLYHNALYKKYVLDDLDGPGPPLPPYYNDEFFDAIKMLKNDRRLVENITMKEWYWALVVRYMTMVVEPRYRRCWIQG